jgi:hypothetical protein
MEEETSRATRGITGLATYPTFSLDAYVYFGSNLCTAPAVMGMQAQHTAAENSTCLAKRAHSASTPTNRCKGQGRACQKHLTASLEQHMPIILGRRYIVPSANKSLFVQWKGIFCQGIQVKKVTANAFFTILFDM